MSVLGNFSVIVLAAGQGKRMRSTLPKVLHPIAGKPMLARTLEILKKVGLGQIVIVVSPQNIAQVKKSVGASCKYAIQKAPLGTADATKSGLELVNKQINTVCVMYGDDSAFYRPETIVNVFKKHQKSNAKITFVTLYKENPAGLGRIIRKNGKLAGIIEEKDTSYSEKQIKEVNDGLYFFDKKWLQENISKLKKSLITGELYLTDLISLALNNYEKVETYKLRNPSQWHGINTQDELEAANRKLAVNFSGSWRIHIMGIAGAGAAAVAGIAKGSGFSVSGCDLQPISPYSKNLNIKIHKGHHPLHLKNIDTLVISPAVTKLNPSNKEVKEAKNKKIPVLTWQEFQGKVLQKDKFVIAVAGAFGKSTTTAMISQILIDAGLDPTCEIGARILEWKKNFRIGKSGYYVCEADEYNNNFLNYKPDIAVILVASWDHPDFFKTQNDVISSYKKFIDNIKYGGTLIIPSSHSGVRQSRAIESHADAIASLQHDVRKDIKIIKISNFDKIKLSIIGNFRKENASAALTVAKILGIDLGLAKKTVENFKGIGRRLEYKGSIQDVKFYDDYAVQPYTIKTTTNALKEKFKNKRLALALEPHTFSRIETFFKEFVQNLKEASADQILITDVYAAREHGDKKKPSRKLAKAIGYKAQYTGSIDQTANYLKNHLGDFDIILSTGAGDVYKVYELLKTHQQ